MLYLFLFLFLFLFFLNYEGIQMMMCGKSCEFANCILRQFKKYLMQITSMAILSTSAILHCDSTKVVKYIIYVEIKEVFVVKDNEDDKC